MFHIIQTIYYYYLSRYCIVLYTWNWNRIAIEIIDQRIVKKNAYGFVTRVEKSIIKFIKSHNLFKIYKYVQD